MIMIRRIAILLIALVLSLVIWWIGPLVYIASFRPLATVMVRATLITLIAIWALWPWVAGSLAWLLRQSRGTGKPLDQGRQRDRVSGRFYDAMRALKHTGLVECRSFWQRCCYLFFRRYRNDKPWIMVLGPSGSGKTSLITESGQRFQLSEQYGLRHTADVGPTLDANWWLTDKAVFIDTAGEWLQLNGLSEEASRAQRRIYALIRRFRRHPAIDGVILCLDSAWLLNASLTERKSMTDALCARVQEMASFFRHDIKVYLALNNIDALPGGEEFLAVMDDDLLSQGVGFAMTTTREGQIDYIGSDAAYSDLLMSISHYVHSQLHRVDTAEQRRQLLFFTESLGNLRKPLFSLLEQVFPQLPVGHSGCLRHVWFGSTRVFEGNLWMGEDVDIRSTGKLYGAMFNSAIAERGVLNHRALSWRHRAGLLLRYAMVIVLLAGTVNVLASRYFWEEDYIAYITARFNETKRMVREIPATNRVSDDLVSAYEQLGYMAARQENSDSPLGNPYFEHSLINREAEQTYRRHLFKFFWPALERYIIEELQRDISTNKQTDIYDTLKIYLMMAKPEYRSATELENWFALRWHLFAPQGYSDHDKRVFRQHLAAVFSDTLRGEAPVTKLRADLVRFARVKAMSIPIHTRVLRDLESRVPATIENVSLASAAGANVSLVMRRKGTAVVTDMAVPAFYTLNSYRHIFNPLLDAAVEKMVKEEAWVLQDSDGGRDNLNSQGFRQKLTDDVRKFYLLEYAEHWEAFLKDIRVRPISSLDDAALLARQFSAPSSPLSNLLRFITRQTSLTSSEDEGAVSGWLNKRHESMQRRVLQRMGSDDPSMNHYPFRIVPEKELEHRFDAVRRLGRQLTPDSGENTDTLSRQFEEIYSQLSTLALTLRAGEVQPQNTIGTLRIAAAQQPEPVRGIMQDLLDVGNTQREQLSRQNLNNSAQTFVAAICRDNIGKQYPFDRRARNEIGIGDFARIFSPSGAMKRYFDQHILPYVDDTGGTLRVRNESRGLLSVGTLRSFENAKSISETFFNQGGDQVAFALYLRPLSLSPNIVEAVLDIDGQVIRYSHGNMQPINVLWPGKNGGAYVRLSFKDVNGRIESVNFNGPWALFRLYDMSNPVPLDRDRQELTMGISSMNGLFKMELRSTLNDFPLWSKALRHFPCPGIKNK
ncbi:type VI secretion system membrane subunit TssM [Pantoea sp. y20]